MSTTSEASFLSNLARVALKVSNAHHLAAQFTEASKTAPFDCLFSNFHFPSSQFFFHLKICLCLQNNLWKHCFKNQHHQQLVYKDILILSLFSTKVGQFCWSPYVIKFYRVFLRDTNLLLLVV